MPRCARRLLLAMVLGIVSRPAGSIAWAQESLTLRSDVLLYGDNTEFRNPFREGETLFGAAARVFLDIDLNPRVTLSLGGFGNQRFGSDSAFEIARPVIAMTVHGRRSTFTFGTLPARGVDTAIGPDRGGPHALLPPLQRETLAFERPYEAGLQWDVRGARLAHSVWLEWQQLNTPEHRERFDGGAEARIAAGKGFAVPFQAHVVHEGGQLFAAGPVRDSAAIAAGLAYARATRGTVFTMEGFALAATSVPDRQQDALDRRGRAFFARAAAERGGWRAHAIAWRGRTFVKDEGDPNYLSLQRDGHVYGGIRDYAEAGVSRRFTLAPGAVVEVSGRLHRTERHYEYSYRVLSIAALNWKLR
jgi:hypothetical protein